MRDATQPLTGNATTKRAISPQRLARRKHTEQPTPLRPSGYELRNVIGEGGMGEVLAAFDTRIGREVAIKRMRDSRPSPDAIARFVREAQIQGRLDHPAIVPVHELATDEHGVPYFTMKRISGETLERRAAEGTPLHQLLRAFVDVCLAVELAHTRGVVHRDLKPSNVMLGDYGEVYVLDWGIARVMSKPALAAGTLPCVAIAGDTDGDTRTGALMGTLGYIAPELYKGALATPATDVYALGAILFELLAGETLHAHQARDVLAAVASPPEYPSRRRPDRTIAPELDQVCFEALSEHPDDRPTAHALADRVQAYLDGDRDLDRRRELAASHLRAAEEALATGGADARIVALRRASRGLALDPDSKAIASFISSLLIASPDPVPPALAAHLDDHDRDDHRDRSRKAVLAYLALSLLLPLMFLLDVRDWRWFAMLPITVGIAIAASLFHLRRGRPSIPLVVLTSLAVIVVFSRIASPFVLTPVLMTTTLVTNATIPWFSDRAWAVIGWTLTAVMLPFVLEWLGVLSSSWTITNQGMLIRGQLFDAHGHRDEIALVVANLVCATIGGLLALGIIRRQRAAQRQLSIQAWHLAGLVPRADTQREISLG
jgi:serine/threonine-protein kinase